LQPALKKIRSRSKIEKNERPSFSYWFCGEQLELFDLQGSEKVGWIFQTNCWRTTVLLQPVKPLFPFGYPYAYKINHHHQNIMSFRKPKIENEKLAIKPHR
jgi:hypothetical protein